MLDKVCTLKIIYASFAYTKKMWIGLTFLISVSQSEKPEDILSEAFLAF